MNIKIAFPVATALLILIGIVGLIFANKPTSPTAVKDAVQIPITASPTTSQTYTLATVATHKDTNSCWSAINGKVYDLTSWINQHPGGPENILAICGLDGSAAFNAQHGGQGRPANELQMFYIGELSN